jgi:hypothetical protein
VEDSKQQFNNKEDRLLQMHHLSQTIGDQDKINNKTGLGAEDQDWAHAEDY